MDEREGGSAVGEPSHEFEPPHRQSSELLDTDKPSLLADKDEPLEPSHPVSTRQSNRISLSEVEPVDVRVRKLSVEIDTSPSPLQLIDYLSDKRRYNGESKSRKKSILCDVDADMPRGTLTAIIGGSGSGKTSLLNVMAERMTSRRLTFAGSTTFNGNPGVNKIRSAYVMQQDVLLPSLTVRETLQYSADLRLPPPATGEDRRRVVEEVILELGLKECADTRVGSTSHKGISGGEKRRTSLAVQLLSNPSVLFLDEPTTGLDATSAFQLVRTLKNLAERGRTIITTIHQPRSEIWKFFDHLIILTKGQPVYSGPTIDCEGYFRAQGLELPPFVNPAEFFVDIAAIDNRSPELEAASSERVGRLTSAWLRTRSRSFASASIKPETQPSLLDNQIIPTDGHASSFFRQVRVLTARTLTTTYRDPMGMSSCVVEAAAMGLVTGYIFYDLSLDQAGIRSREGALYTAAALQGYLILIYETYRLTFDIQLFDRERNEGVVDVIPFLLSRRFARCFLEDLPVPLVYSCIFYWMAGFRADVTQFFTFFAIVLLTQYIAVAFAMTCVAASRNFAGASLIGNLGYTVQSMACGFFLQVDQMPVYIRWIKWTAYVFYGFGALCANEFVGHFYECPHPGGESNPDCAQYTGTYIMTSLGFPQNWIVIPIIALVAYAVFFYVVAGLGLRFKRVEMSIARARRSDLDFSAGKEKMLSQSIDEVRAIKVSLDNFALQIQKRKLFARKLPDKQILRPISADFDPGVLNVIMGPSGSGKTSLLNAMALRLHDDMSTKYHASGSLKFNGAAPSSAVIRSICSYVCQDDDALLPSLTVRETLRYSANLRLPSHMSKSEKFARAEEVLLQMGLKDCADNLIGSELMKGISGGEKRRVTIAIQILTNPRILLLDEPTSGLDAFTATSIIDVLRGLAQEGRTLIMTIHQARSDLFRHFGRVLLLTRGGSPVYAGPGSAMLSYFESLGYPCSRSTNPADFALDLITIDLQHSSKEKASRDKVQGLIQAWVDNTISKASNAILSTNEIALPAELGSLQHRMAPFQIAYPLILSRATINFRRQPALLVARLMQVLGFAIVLALFFAPLKYDYESIQTRVGFIQECCALYFVGMLQNVAIYPSDKEVFYREHDDGIYSVEAFLAMYTTLELPFEIVTSILFAVLIDLAAGLPRTAQMYWVCFFNCFCIVNCGESLGIMFNTFFAHTGFAINITSVILSMAQIMSGVMSITMPTFLQDMNYLSPIRYAIRNLAPYSLRDIHFTCDATQAYTNGTCILSNGIEVLNLYQLNSDPVLNIMELGICVVVYRLLAYFLLKIMRTRWDEINWSWKNKGKPS